MISPFAAELVGIPFAEGARDFRPVHGGTDCLGIVLEFRRLEGLRSEDPWEDLRDHWCGGAEQHMPTWLQRRDGALRLGDVGVAQAGAHVLVYVGGGWVLEAVRGVGTRLARLRDVQVDSWWGEA